MTRSALTTLALACGLAVATPALAQTSKRPSPSTRKPVPPPAAVTRTQAVLQCPADLGVGVKTQRRFCDVLTGRDPKDGIIVTIPPHRGPVTLSFALHNRHTYSEDLVKSGRAFRQYTATIGVLEMDNTLVDRAIVQSEFRSEADLFDRISGGAGPGGIKAVAPSGDETIVMELPAEVASEVSILGEKLSVVRPDGVDNFSAPGRPIATISNVMLEYRPAPRR